MSTNGLSSRVILVRHGRSSFNDQGRYQGSSNEAVLTLKGIETARQVGKYLHNIPIDAVYTSPLLRAQQTTREIMKAMAHRSPPTVSHDLREIDLSIWEGLSYDHVHQHYQDTYNCWRQHPETFKLPDTDGNDYFPVKALYERAEKFWAHSLTQHPGKTLLVVSHGGTNHALISSALGISPQHHHSLQQSNCGINQLEFSGQDVQLLQLNQTTVIHESLPKLKAGKRGLRLLLLAEDSLTTVACQQLAHRLAAIKLDFCLSTIRGQQWLSTLLQYHPKITRFIEERSEFLKDWQPAWTDSFGADQELLTGIAIAPTISIQTLLIQTLGGPPTAGNKLTLKPGHLSVIHYPKNHRPIVQAINI